MKYETVPYASFVFYELSGVVTYLDYSSEMSQMCTFQGVETLCFIQVPIPFPGPFQITLVNMLVQI